jgi:UDP-GlcNAc:undecaprenyl-phosphate GlcNAc-1-phosphate transferase
LPDEARLGLAFLVSLIATSALTPGAIRLATRMEFYDRPVGYKAHAAPTAYLGGAALIVGFVLAASLTSVDRSLLAPIAAGAVGLAVLGTLDDRMTVRPRHRLAAEAGAATLLWAAGAGWGFLSSGFEQLVLTVIWVVAFTNAFNLMDNMDGAGASVGAVCAAGIAGLAISLSDVAVAALALALCGACVGFLPFNLRSAGPARIFLGDGGSMPIGFLLAALTMNVAVHERLGWPVLLVGGMLLGALVLDTTLVIVSRSRRGVALVTAGRDHLTHRLHARLASAGWVAATLVLAQAAVAGLAVAALHAGRTAIVATAVGCLSLGAAVIALLESPGWAPVFPDLAEAAAQRETASEALAQRETAGEAFVGARETAR